LTLAQTRKLDRKIAIVLYGTSYWNEILNFDALVRHGMIAKEDLDLFQFADEPSAALDLLRASLTVDTDPVSPCFAKSRTSRRPGE
jgi:predicted Rossmann-fold nucleotide-binding protein